LGIPGCKYPEGFNCADRILFASKTNPPLYDNGAVNKPINPNFGLEFSPEFRAYKGGHCRNGCGTTGFFAKNDGRLVQNARNMPTFLDRPPYEANIGSVESQTSIYTEPKYSTFGARKYTDYRDINLGQIMYYYDKSTADPYFQPNFVRRVEVDYSLFKDPMGAIKPEYFRTNSNFTNYNFSKDQFTRDSMDFREDLMERQMRVMNQQKFDSRYYSIGKEDN
jgi:hypothetical protein